MQKFGEATTLKELMAIVRERRKALGITQRDFDDIAGLQPGYQGKLEAGVKHPGYLSLPCILGALGLKLIVVEAEAGLPRVTRSYVESPPVLSAAMKAPRGAAGPA
jgi:predicted transcriptional regulator